MDPNFFRYGLILPLVLTIVYMVRKRKDGSRGNILIGIIYFFIALLISSFFVTALATGTELIINLSHQRHITFSDPTVQFSSILIAIFFSLTCLGMVLLTYAAFGWDSKKIYQSLLSFLLVIIVPLSLLFFIVALSYVMWQHFTGEKESPLWVLGVCSIFVTLLIPAFFGYIKTIFDGRKKKKSKNPKNSK